MHQPDIKDAAQISVQHDGRWSDHLARNQRQRAGRRTRTQLLSPRPPAAVCKRRPGRLARSAGAGLGACAPRAQRTAVARRRCLSKLLRVRLLRVRSVLRWRPLAVFSPVWRRGLSWNHPRRSRRTRLLCASATGAGRSPRLRPRSIRLRPTTCALARPRRRVVDSSFLALALLRAPRQLGAAARCIDASATGPGADRRSASFCRVITTGCSLLRSTRLR